MALVLCPACGEESLDRLMNCPACNEPLPEGKARNESRERTLKLFGFTFVGGVIAATLLNIAGWAYLAILCGVTALLGLAGFLLKLNATN